MAFVLLGLVILLGLVQLGCFVMVIIKMFQNQQTGLAIASILTIPCGIGGLIAFVMGWVKSSEWQTKNIMMVWTGAFVVALILNFASMAFVGTATSTTFSTMSMTIGAPRK